MYILNRYSPVAMAVVAFSACTPDLGGAWQGTTSSDHTIEFDIIGDQISGEIGVNPDNVHGCHGTGADNATFDFEGTLDGGWLEASLYNPEHPSDAEITGHLRASGVAEGEASGGVELYGIDASGQAMSCDALFEVTWTANHL